MKLIILLLLCALNIPAVFAQTADSKPENQFDFWLGEWDLSWVDENGKQYRGENKVISLFDGKVIEENFDGLESAPLKGKSFSVYNKQKKIWEQIWVDNNGSFMAFEGGKTEDKMVLSRTWVIKGKDVKQRMIFYNIRENSFNWDWQSSEDQGKTWQTLWTINYKRNN